jgi:hypothetical protein
LLGELLNSVKRITKAFQIWRIDCQYRALGDYRDDLRMNQIDVEKAPSLLMRRRDLRVEMLEAGATEMSSLPTFDCPVCRNPLSWDIVFAHQGVRDTMLALVNAHAEGRKLLRPMLAYIGLPQRKQRCVMSALPA